MADRDNFDRDRERNWDRGDRERGGDRGRERERGDRWNERGGAQFGSSGDWGNNRREEQTNRGGEWGRESRQERHDQFTRGDESERWRDRGSSYGQSRGMTENYQRGGSGSEGGYGSERSHGTSRGFTERGGGTGMREDERWAERNRERGGSFEYGRGATGGGFSNTGYGSGWGGGLSGFAGSAGTYMDRGQQSQGRFSGRGPKGWRRSDERIREDVCERLTMHPDIDATDIDVQVRDCEVTLAGAVDDRHVKRMAEDVVENISGVKEVHNQIRVRRMDDRGREQGGSETWGAQQRSGQPAQHHPGQQTHQQYGEQRGQQSTQQPQHSGAGQTNRTHR